MQFFTRCSCLLLNAPPNLTEYSLTNSKNFLKRYLLRNITWKYSFIKCTCSLDLLSSAFILNFQCIKTLFNWLIVFWREAFVFLDSKIEQKLHSYPGLWHFFHVVCQVPTLCNFNFYSTVCVQLSAVNPALTMFITLNIWANQNSKQ